MVIKKLVAMVTVLMLSVRDAAVSLSMQDTDRATNISRQQNHQGELRLIWLQQQRDALENNVFRTKKYLCLLKSK